MSDQENNQNESNNGHDNPRSVDDNPPPYEDDGYSEQTQREQSPSAPVMVPSEHLNLGWNVNRSASPINIRSSSPAQPRSGHYEFVPPSTSTPGFIDVETPDSYRYKYFPAPPNGITIRICAAHDAHLAFTSSKTDPNSILEVFIGTATNTKSVIRKNRDDTDAVDVDTPFFLCSNKMRGFCIRWENQNLTVSKENDISPFMTCQITEPFDINFVGIRTVLDATGKWKIETVCAHPTSYDIQPSQNLYLNNPTTYNTNFDNVSSYSWVSAYRDRIPDGAFEGGRDLNGDILYVGRAEHRGSLTPGKVSRALEGCLIPWGGGEHGKNSYEILVGNARWIQSSGSEIPETAIIGGNSEIGEPLYIGRASHGSTLTVGKVHPSHGFCYIGFGGREHKYSVYEILAE